MAIGRCSGEADGDLLGQEVGAQRLTISGMLEAVGVCSIVGFVTRWTHGRTRHLLLARQWRAAVLQSYKMALEGGGDV